MVAISNLKQLLAAMKPELNGRSVAFMSFADGMNPFSTDNTICTFAEAEGLTVVAELSAAEASGHRIWFRAAWITLSVHSDLEAVGLTGAFASALADHGISANVIAGAYHDHIFVPLDKTSAAMEALIELQKGSTNL